MRNLFPIRRATSLLRFSGALNRPLSAHVSRIFFLFLTIFFYNYFYSCCNAGIFHYLVTIKNTTDPDPRRLFRDWETSFLVFMKCCMRRGSKLSAPSFGNLGTKQNVSAPYALGFRNFIHSTGRRDDEMGRSSRPMDFVRGIIVEDGKRFMGSSHFPGYSVEQIADCLLKADVQ